VTNRDLFFKTADEYRETGPIPMPLGFILEPQGRNTAPAIAAAAITINQQYGPEAVMLFLTADHLIADVKAFTQAVQTAVKLAESGKVTTFGIKPDHPATGYGYIQPGKAISSGIFEVAAFVEKPSLEVAKAYLAKGYVWNSGNFAFAAKTLMGEFEAFAPAIADAVRKAVAWARREGDQVFLDADAFGKATKTSLDYAVMEKTTKAAVVPADFGWSDLGAWEAIWQVSARDGDGNALMGDVLALDSRNTLVRANGLFVGAIGVEDLAIVAEGDAVLVCRRQDSQAVKAMVDTLKAQGRSLAYRHLGDQSLLRQDGIQVSRLAVAPGQTGEIPAGHYLVLQGALTLETGETLDRAAHGVFDQPVGFSSLTGCLLLLTAWS
jgi:mannose-1-phosphate guanylyltransferase